MDVNMKPPQNNLNLQTSEQEEGSNTPLQAVGDLGTSSSAKVRLQRSLTMSLRLLFAVSTSERDFLGFRFYSEQPFLDLPFSF